jgi:hypothetical protein
VDADAARDLYAAGWAASGGPLTDRVRAGSVACQHLSRHLDEAATLRLGHLEGVWAAIYDRRERVLTDGIGKALAVWHADPPDLPELVRQVRVQMGIGEATPDVPPQIVGLAAEALLRQRARDDLTLILGEGLAAAHAEGTVGALALAADQAGYLGFAFDLAFDDAVAALAGLDGAFWTDVAATYVTDALNGSVNELGRRLAAGIRDGLTRDEMLAGVEDLFANANAIAYATDLALSAALTQGALSLYTQEGVAQAAFVTAGDGRVCPMCEEAEAEGPYLLTDLPAPPLHGRCRCCVQAIDPLPTSAFAPYITDPLAEG